MSLYAQDRHKRAAKMLGYALTLDSLSGWQSAAYVWALRLTTGERAALLMAAAWSMEPDEALFVIREAIPGAGAPDLASWEELHEAAQCWAGYASPAELCAYAKAAIDAMPDNDRRVFLRDARGAVS